MQEDGERGGVGCEDDDLGDTAVEGLGGLVGALLQLLVVGGLLNDVEDLLGESGVGGGPGWRGGMLGIAGDGNGNGWRGDGCDGGLTGRSVLFFGHFECGL